jgi:hypothetical protein
MVVLTLACHKEPQRSLVDSTDTHAVTSAVSTPSSTTAAASAGAANSATSTEANAVTLTGTTPELVACVDLAYKGFPGIAEAGLQTPEHRQQSLDMGLYASAQQNDIDCAGILLRAGANPNGPNSKNGTLDSLSPLLIAADAKNVKLAKLLLKYHADPRLAWEGRTPLQFAARAGSVSLVKELLALNVDVNAITDQGFTPLWDAAARCHTDVVILLLNHGAKTNYRDKLSNKTPIEIARANECADTAEVLAKIVQ